MWQIYKWDFKCDSENLRRDFKIFKELLGVLYLSSGWLIYVNNGLHHVRFWLIVENYNLIKYLNYTWHGKNYKKLGNI